MQKTWTAEQFRQYMNTGQEPTKAQPATKSKYCAEKTEVNNIKFDSKKEAQRYNDLMLMQQAGCIERLKLQETFVLLRAFKTPEGKNIKALSYKADFTYWKNGEYIVEDVKGYKKGQAYQIFLHKKKLMNEIYFINVEEV